MILYHPFTSTSIREYVPKLETLRMNFGATPTDIRADLLVQYLEGEDQRAEIYACGAFDGEKIVGSALLLISEGALSRRRQTQLIGEIDGVFVAPQYRRMHVASRLVNRLLFIGGSKNVHHCELVAETRAAQALYESLGFVCKDKTIYHFEFPRQRTTSRSA